MAQDRAKRGQDGLRSEMDERRMAQDVEDELQDEHQDRQDAVSDGRLEHLMKKTPVGG